MPFQRCIIRPGALGGFRIRAILSRNKIISITHPPRQLRTWEYYRQNRTVKLDFMRHQWQALECFWKSNQKNTLITGFQTCNEHGTSGGSKPVCIGDLHMGLISRLHQLHASHPAMNLATYLDSPGHCDTSSSVFQCPGCPTPMPLWCACTRL